MHPYASLQMAADHAIILPSNRDQFLCEALVTAEDPLLLQPSRRLATVAAMVGDAEKLLSAAEYPEGMVAELKALKPHPEKHIIGANMIMDQHLKVGMHPIVLYAFIHLHACLVEVLTATNAPTPRLLRQRCTPPSPYPDFLPLQCLAQTGAKRCGHPTCYISALSLTKRPALIQEVAGEELPHSQAVIDPKTIETLQDLLEGQSQLEQLIESRCVRHWGLSGPI
jgi:hypothetical protein